MNNSLVLSNFDRLFGPFEKLLAWPDEKANGGEFREWLAPAVDVKESDTGWTFYADLPGIKADDIDVHLENNSLVISAKHSSEVSDSKDHYIHTERHSGSYQRCFTLPSTADTQTVAAKHENGVLRVSVAKKKSLQPRKISVAIS